MAKKLDRTRPFGTVAGDPEGRQFHQDGVYFDVDGNEHGAGKKAAPPEDPPPGGKKGGKRGAAPPEDPPPENPPAGDPTDDQIRAQVGGA